MLKVPRFITEYAAYLRKKIKDAGTDEPYRIGAIDEINNNIRLLERGMATTTWVMKYMAMIDETIDRITRGEI